jgi:hypothetical protein
LKETIPFFAGKFCPLLDNEFSSACTQRISAHVCTPQEQFYRFDSSKRVRKRGHATFSKNGRSDVDAATVFFSSSKKNIPAPALPSIPHHDAERHRQGKDVKSHGLRKQEVEKERARREASPREIERKEQFGDC